jgi:hypothetical protein
LKISKVEATSPQLRDQAHGMPMEHASQEESERAIIHLRPAQVVADLVKRTRQSTSANKMR